VIIGQAAHCIRHQDLGTVNSNFDQHVVEQLAGLANEGLVSS
jgi:hypothetical protein